MSYLKKFIKGKIQMLHSKPASVQDYDNMIFGQLNCGNKQYFDTELGQHKTVRLADLPHYDFVQSVPQDIKPDCKYGRYLQASWRHRYRDKSAQPSIQARMERFADLYSKTCKRLASGKEIFPEPVVVCKRPDGKLLLVDGNHRASIGLALNKPVRLYHYTPEKYIEHISAVPEIFYGSARLGMPYQSIYDGDKLLVEGRRSDIKERIDMIDPADLRGKSLLELGCNIGANCFCAIQVGATSAVGIDVPGLIDVALRLNCYFNYNCRFEALDLNDPLTGIEPADVMFCFSVYKHINNKKALIDTIMNKTKKILFFEGHGNTTLEDYQDLLNKDNFKSIELIGHTRNGIHSKKRNRPLFRCEV